MKREIILAVLLLIVIPFIGGIVIWLSYPHIHAVFPSAIDSGILAKELGFWDSCCISWLVRTLFGNSPNTRQNKRED